MKAAGAYEPGAKFYLELDELGFSGVAKVSAVELVQIPPGDGRLITTTMTHLNDDVYDVRFVEDGSPLRGTGAHPLHSLDRDEWVQVGDLRVGERLQTAEGAVSVEALEKVRGVHRVYNLEVEGDHEYLVGEAGVRAHNACPVPSVRINVIGDAAETAVGQRVRTLQSGGRTLSKRSLNSLGLTKEQGKRAIEGMKKDVGLRSGYG